MITAWLTILVACVPAFYETRDWWRGIVPSLAFGPGLSRPKYALEVIARQLLDALCDLQTITGLSILLAGLTQTPGITYYHQELVMDFWYLTLLSFWAARSEFLHVDLASK